MKLLVIIPRYWPVFSYGGPIFSQYYLDKTLVKKGIDVTVYTTCVALDRKDCINQEINIDGVKITYFAFTNLFEFISPVGWQFSWPMTRALRRNLKTFDLIYIVTVWSYPTLIAAYYSRLYKKPYLVATHGMLYPDLFYKKTWKKWPYYHFAVKKALKNACAIHYTTENEAEETRSLLNLKNRTIIVPSGIELPEFSDLIDREKLVIRYPYLRNKKIILFLGRINWKKGLDILVEAYAKLVKERDDVHLLIAGYDDKRYSQSIKRWIRKYGMNYVDYGLKDRSFTRETQVTFTGTVTEREKIEVYKGCDIFVLPSYSENFGLAVVEAMAYRVPVVVSNKVGIYKEIKRHKAGIVIETNAKSLYQGIKLLLENPGLRREIAINGRKLVEENYAIDKVADKMIEAYQEILTR